MKIYRSLAILVPFACALIFLLTPRTLPPVFAQNQEPGMHVSESYADNLQRSIHINSYTTVTDSGSARGEIIYFYKCWMCHNQYTIAAGTPAPYLKDLYKRQTLMTTGQPVNDQSVTTVIKNGNSLMPSFRTALSDSDIADLVSYLSEGKCCAEGAEPPQNPWYRAETQKWPVQSGLLGGATGMVRVASGSPEGIKVQLIAPNGVRTTVYTNEEGAYQFPRMESGSYVLRIATPLEFKPYKRDAVQVRGNARIDDIVLERVSKTEALPATNEIESQLSGEEVLWNLPGTGEEKKLFRGCGRCHSYQQALRPRYDERSWRLIVRRMLHYSGASLVNASKEGVADTEGGSDSVQSADEETMLVKWLARVRGPDSKDAPIYIFPRPHGMATKVVITEYELPRLLLNLHDAGGDPDGNVWYTSHKSRYFGKLDPKTGIVTEYALPLTPGAMPGTHHVAVDKSGVAWLSEVWAHNLVRLEPKTKQLTQIPVELKSPTNNAGFSNFGLAPDGSIWDARDGSVNKLDPETGKIVQRFPLKTHDTYDNTISSDGKYWAGGAPGGGGNSLELLNIKTGQMLVLTTGPSPSNPRRGGFDPFGNAWFGGRNGTITEIGPNASHLHEYFPPTPISPYTDFYEAMPDKNGEVWAGVLSGRGMVRYNPKKDQWTEYVLPEPYGWDRRTWIDNSTTPVTVWYADYHGYLVRIQPLE